MTRFQVDLWPAQGGAVASYSAVDLADPGGPVVVMLHGALRSAEVLFPWADRLAGVCRTLLMDLPGHGRSPCPGPLSVAHMAEVVGEAIGAALPGRQVLLVGESLGGAVALAIGGARPGPVAAVLAADPPMSTAKLWHTAAAFRALMGKTPQPGLADRLGSDAFGVTPTGVDEKIYYPLLDALRVPATIVTGDIPLLPPRPLAGVACVFDAVDRFVVERFYAGKVTVRQIADCGHVVLADAPDACRALIEEMLGGLPSQQPAR